MQVVVICGMHFHLLVYCKNTARRELRIEKDIDAATLATPLRRTFEQTIA